MESVQPNVLNKSTSRLRNNSGQGILEYILVLVVTVGIISGVMWRFSDTFRAWANNYFGEYLSCLLETGELPTVGGTGGVAGGGFCNKFFEPFTFSAGRPPTNPGGDGGTTGNGSSKKDTSSSRKDTAKSAGGSSRIPTSSQRGGSRSSSGDSASNGGEIVGKIKGDKAKYTGSTGDSMPAGVARRNDATTKMKVRRYDMMRGFQTDKPEAMQREARIAVKGKESAGLQDKRRILVKRKLASTIKEDKDEGMDFGDYFRIFIIAAIIIALVLVIGGQLLQASKGAD